MRLLKSRNVLGFCFICYCICMFWLLFIRARGVAVSDYWSQVAGRINLIPFSSMGSMIRTLWENPRPDVAWLVVYNLGGNIVMFVPLGFFLAALWERFRRFSRCMGAVALIMATVETAQVLTLRGFCEVDDVMLNLCGAAIGWAISRKWKR